MSGDRDSSGSDAEGLYRFLYAKADTMRTDADLLSAEAVLRYLLRQEDVSRSLRREIHLLLATLSYGDNPPTSTTELKIRSIKLQIVEFIDSALLCCFRSGRDKPNELSQADILEFHNQARADRIRRESVIEPEGGIEMHDLSGINTPSEQRPSKGKGKEREVVDQPSTALEPEKPKVEVVEKPKLKTKPTYRGRGEVGEIVRESSEGGTLSEPYKSIFGCEGREVF